MVQHDCLVIGRIEHIQGDHNSADEKENDGSVGTENFPCRLKAHA